MMLPHSFLEFGQPIAIDTETTGLRVYQGDKILGFSVSTRDGDWYYSVAHPYSSNIPQLDAVTILQAVAKHGVVVMHNSCFDRAVLALGFGIEFEDSQIWDTQCGDWLIDEAADHRLKEIGARLWGYEAKAEAEALKALRKGRSVTEVYRELRDVQNVKPRAERERAAVTRDQAREIAQASKKDWRDLTADDISEYAKQDTRLTLDLYHYQLREGPLQDEHFLAAMEREQLVLGQCYRFTRVGVHVDLDAAVQSLEAAEAELAAIAEPWSHVNLRSANQKAALVYDEWGLPCNRRTKAGARSTDRFALEALSYDPRVQALQRYAKLAKEVDAFYFPLIDRRGDDGKVHPSFNPNRTVSGRLASFGPNIQQIPKVGPVRSLFVPPPGFAFLSADLPSAELRIMAILSEEPAWLEAFDKGTDFHQATADATGLTRQIAKTLVYSVCYGVQGKTLATTLAQGTGQPPDVKAAYDYIRKFWKGVPRVRRLFDGLSEAWQRRGKLPIRPYDGRYRHFTDRTGWPRPYAAMDYVVQGSIAELVKDWGLALEPEIDALGGYLLMQCHDSLIACVPEGAVAAAKPLFQATLDAVNPFGRLAWPLDIKDEF